jgi:hypothetical protein
MARALRVLGAGYDQRGLFINVRFLDRSVHPDQRIDVTTEQLLGLTRSMLSALEVAEHERARADRAKQQTRAS